MSKTPFIIAFVIGLLLSFTVSARAATFNYDIEYNGEIPSLALISDIPAGQALLPGDSFDLTVRAQGNSFFRVIEEFRQFVAASFVVAQGGTRIANIVTTLYLDDVIVHSAIDSEVAQHLVHIGAQSLSIPQGRDFDRLTLGYQLLDSDAPTVISPSADILAFTPFFRFPDQIAYVRAAISAVPLSESGAYYLTVLCAFYVLRRRFIRARWPRAGTPSGG